MNERGNPNFKEYPHKITLCFKSEEEKKYFLGQLSDGWGENECSLDWPWLEEYNKTGKINSFHKQKKFAVTVFIDGEEFQSDE